MSINSIFDRDEFKPYKDAWESRQKILAQREAYYKGTVYDGRTWWGALAAFAPKLRKNIRPLFQPIAAAVDVDAGIIPAGWAFKDDADEKWTEARDTVFEWSKWDTSGVLFVHYGAMLGVTGLRISDLREPGRVLVEAVSPRKFMLIGGSIYDDEPEAALWVENRVDIDGKTYEYAEVHTKNIVSTYKSGQPFGYDGRKPLNPNNIGVVPFVEGRHIENGEPLSEPTFQKAIRMLDEVNKLATDLSTTIERESIEVQWIGYGMEPTELTRGDGNIWFASSSDARFDPLVPGVDIAGVLEFIRDMKQDVKDALPEKDFDELRHKDQIATDTLTIQLTELVLKIKRCRPNYDRALVKALQIAGKAAATMNLGDIAVLDDEKLKFDPDRPIIPETPTDKINRIGETWRLVGEVSDEPIPAEVILKDLGYGEDKLSEFGSAKLAAIRARQEDKIPEMRQ